jgi:Tfp pilus assembly protein PilN
LNLLPARHRIQRLSTRSLLTWILLAALMAMLPLTWRWFATSSETYRLTAEQGDLLRRTVQEKGGSAAELDTLATTVAAAEDSASQLEAALASLGIRNVVWGDSLAVVLQRMPEGVTLTGITDEGGAVRLEGTALDEKAPLAFVDGLVASGSFQSVRLEALDRLTGDESPTPASPTPTAAARARATPSPTPTLAPAEPRFSFVLTLQVIGATHP